MKALQGVRVLDLSRLLPGPYATMVLADLGADVVKVEDPDLGDYLRNLPPLTSGGGGGMFAALNRGKRSLSLDLKAPGGAALLARLATKVDVVVEGFRPGVLDRLGCGPAKLLQANPRLIVCSITGFGQTGPWRDKAGHDIGYLALSGVLARCGTGALPQLPGVQLADLFGGSQSAVIAILAALLQRDKTGQGAHLDVSMTEGVMGFLLPHLGALAAGQPPQARGEDVLSGSMPCYRVYACKDGAMALGALEPKFWQRFCQAVEIPDWESRQFDREIVPDVEDLFLGMTREECTALLGPADCCCEPVLEPHEVLQHPLHAGRDLTVVSDGLPLLRSQAALGKAADLPCSAAPSNGQHTEELLRELGLSDDDLRQLRAEAVVR